MYRKEKSKPAPEAQGQFQDTDTSPSCPMTPLFKIYSSLFQTEQDFLKVKKTLIYWGAGNTIPLVVIKESANQLEAIIGVLGGITLVTEPNIYEAPTILKIAIRLDLDKDGAEYLANRIHEFVSSIVGTCKDKQFQSCLDQQKEKAWKLLEGLDEYAKSQYKHSIF